MEGFVADGVSAPLPGRCAFYVAKKKRYCKMIVGSGKTFCGEHANAGEEESEKKRIPCPLDPKHTVFEDNLAKHLKKCNSKEKPKPIYYVKDINAGSANEDEPIEEITIAERSKEELEKLIVKLKTALKGLNTKLVEKILSHAALHEPLSDPKNGDSAFKHLKQQASILGNMEVLELLGPNRCYIEFGAGKGKLSHWIHIALKAAENVNFLLVERSSTRFKVDGKHKNTGSTFDRLQVDIQHLDLSKVPLLRKKGLPIIGVGKHLCGAATDLALRCLFEHNCSDKDDEPPTKRIKLHQNEGAGDFIKPVPSTEGRETGERLIVSGLAIALCCHHRCDWRHYVGKDFFTKRGLGPEEFAAFQRMSSWATCGMRKIGSNTTDKRSEHKTGEEEEHEICEDTLADPLNGLMSIEDREQIGWLCKRLIDHGRVYYLQQKGFETNLKYYTSRDISLENVLLTAVPAANQNRDESQQPS